MPKKISFSVLLMLLFLCILTTPSLAKDTVFWYLPHPDDETLGMADAIHQSVLAGNKNYFIYFSKGTSSLARLSLRGPDGTFIQLSESEFGQARVRETLAALRILGVESDQVIFFDYLDGHIPLEPVKETIRLYAKLYPKSIHRTVSLKDTHRDHQTLASPLPRCQGKSSRTI